MRDPPTGPRDFGTTHWSLVLAAKPDDASRTRAQRALGELCQSYWYPLYTFVRSRRYDAEEAKDLTQAFFTRVLETGGFATVDPERGRFRSYLLGAMKHFLANEWKRERAAKRGGGAAVLDMDALDPEARYALAAAPAADPDARFEREWAEAILAQALERLRAESEAKGRGPLFEALKPSLVGEAPDRRIVEEELGLSDGALKVAVHRLRKRYRECVRAVIAETLADPDDIDAEMRHLVTALRQENA